MKNNCPYCLKVLPKKPQRKTKCPFCSKFIFVKSIPKSKGKELVTEKRAEEIEIEWHKDGQVKKWLNQMSVYGITKKDYDNRKNELKQNQKREPNEIDVIWKLFNDLISKTEDYYTLSGIYYQMAIFLYEENRDSMKLLQLSKKMNLLRYYNEGVKEVIITNIANDSCIACKKLNNKVIKINDALKYLPIPNKNCTNKPINNGNFFCRCDYYPISDYYLEKIEDFYNL